MRGARSASVLLLLWLGLTGCAYSIVSDGRIRHDAFDSVLDRTMQARRIRVEAPVEARAVTKSELVGVLETALDAQWSTEELRGYERGLVAMGLWSADHDLRSQLVALYSSEVAGVYVPTTRTMYVVEDVDPPFAIRLLSAISRRDLFVETALTHEIVHLLQHEAHPELLDPSVQRLDQDDVDRAIQASIEGDALRYGYEAMGIGVATLPPDDLRRSVEEELARSDHLQGTPPLLRWTLAFPYVEGYRLAADEGFALLRQPPASTEQVLHPTRREEPFQVFALDAVRAALPARCAFVHANTLGELHLSVLFRGYGVDAVDGAPIWQGWDGDRFLVAECDGSLEFVWLTAWDSETDAGEFEAGYHEIREALSRQVGLEQPPETTRNAREVVVWSAGLSDVAARLPGLASRARVSGLGQLRRHFGLPQGLAPDAARATD